MAVRSLTPGANPFGAADLYEMAMECADAGARVAGTDGLDLASVVTAGYLAKQADAGGLSADALDAHLEGLTRSGKVAPARFADASQYYENDLTGTLREQPFVRPQRERALLANIPTLSVDPGQRFFTIEYLDHETNAAYMRQGDTSPPRAGVSRTEQPPREIHWIWSGVPSDWLARRRDRYAQRDNATQRRAAGILGIEQVMNNALLEPDAGIQSWGLKSGANALPALRSAGLADVSSATGDDVLEDIDAAAAEIAEASDMTMPSPDTVIVDLPLYNALNRKFNFAAGGPGSIGPAIQAVLGRHGITQVQVANELKSFDGANTGAMVFYSRASDMSLRHALGMRPAPVHTYTDARGDVTVFAGCSGGLVTPNRQATYIRTYGL